MRRLILPAFLLACACGGLPSLPVDAGSQPDAGEDAGAIETDAGPGDAGSIADAGLADAGLTDGGALDGGLADAGGELFTPPPLIGSDVKQGDKGLPVGQLQFELKLATGKNLDEDGDFGPATL